jgi:hypothetical protein
MLRATMDLLPSRYAAFALMLAAPLSAQAQPWLAPPRPAARLGNGPLLLDEHPAPGRVPLRLRSPSRPQHVVIEARSAVVSADQPGPILRAAGACNTPCLLWVPRGTLRLRSTAPGLRSTDLDIDVDAATSIDVRAPSSALFNVGTGLTALGATVMIATASVALAQQINGVAADDQLRPTAAIGLSLLGALIMGAGIPLLVAHRTGYRQAAMPRR